MLKWNTICSVFICNTYVSNVQWWMLKWDSIEILYRLIDLKNWTLSILTVVLFATQSILFSIQKKIKVHFNVTCFFPREKIRPTLLLDMIPFACLIRHNTNVCDYHIINQFVNISLIFSMRFVVILSLSSYKRRSAIILLVSSRFQYHMCKA